MSRRITSRQLWAVRWSITYSQTGSRGLAWCSSKPARSPLGCRAPSFSRAPVPARLERPHLLQRLRAERLLGPARGHRGIVREHADVDGAVHDQVVVAGQTDVGYLDHRTCACLRVGVVADQIAQAPQLFGALLLGSLEHRLERRQVAVDVGENDRFHGTGCRVAERRSTGMRRYSTDAVRRILLSALLLIALSVWLWTSAVLPRPS